MFLTLTLLDGAKTLVNTDQVHHMFECQWGTILCFDTERVTVKESLEEIIREDAGIASMEDLLECLQK